MTPVSPSDRIPVSGPWITEKEIEYVSDAVTNAWYSNANMFHERFESAFCAYTRRRHAMALPSCTSAIHLALMALGVGPGDEVIVPEITWIASAAPINYVGATPVFADVDPVTWCLSDEAFRRAITPKTKAVIIVDLYGNMPQIDALLDTATAYGIRVIEDAAEAIGSRFDGRPAGSFGDASVFSFHGSKTLTTGEGGMLVTDDPELFRQANILRDHGRRPGDVSFFNSAVAHKYKMSSMQAALGLAQIERIAELIDRKREIFGLYRDALSSGEIVLNAEPAGTLNSYWMVTALWPSAKNVAKERVISIMRDSGIDVRPFFYPLSCLPAYAASSSAAGAAERNSVSYDLSSRGINLPSGFNVNEAVVERVAASLRSALAKSV
jgi:perosamine synthetase